MHALHSLDHQVAGKLLLSKAGKDQREVLCPELLKIFSAWSRTRKSMRKSLIRRRTSRISMVQSKKSSWKLLYSWSAWSKSQISWENQKIWATQVLKMKLPALQSNTTSIKARTKWYHAWSTSKRGWFSAPKTSTLPLQMHTDIEKSSARVIFKTKISGRKAISSSIWLWFNSFKTIWASLCNSPKWVL